MLALKLGISPSGCKNSLCMQNEINRALLLLPVPARDQVRHGEPRKPLGAAQTPMGPLGVEGATENGREI